MRILRNNQGTSVVEILVVMVVLLVGIMSAIRLFPPGFASVRYAENMTFAGRLGQFEVERWKNNVQNLPEGILPIKIVGGVPEIWNDVEPGPPVSNDNSGCFRRVIGESTRIPFGGWSTGPESGSLYMLAFSPVDTSPGHQIVVRGGDLSRRVFDSAGSAEPWNFLRPYQYGIDYGDQSSKPKICFRRNSQERVFYVSISWWAQNAGKPELRTATSIEIRVPADFGGWMPIWQDPNAPADFMGVDEDSETVSRGFYQLAYGSGWSTNDPYEFQVVDGTLGIIEFNPLGYAQKEFGRPLEARLDYDILDLEIIREDKRVPSGGPFNVSLTLRHLKQNGVSLGFEGDPYPGLHEDNDPNFALQDDIMAVDLETCRVIDLGWSFQNSNVGSVSYKDGLVELPPIIRLMGATPIDISPAGRNIRFFYKAEGDWSVQFHKAYAMYERETANIPLTYKSYFVGPVSGVGGPERIWFARCNMNSTVSVDYEYVDAEGDVKKVIGESHKCSDVREVNVDFTHIDLKWEPIRIFTVRGISARSRVIWRDGERWRYVDLDTTLVRKPAS